ncbi:hypothetical protein LINPERPRIM_LOCUS7235 [Linum perenne]
MAQLQGGPGIQACRRCLTIEVFGSLIFLFPTKSFFFCFHCSFMFAKSLMLRTASCIVNLCCGEKGYYYWKK